MKRPYVDRPVVDLAAARSTAEAALRAWGRNETPELLRVGMNALFAVPGATAVVRVGHATAPSEAAHRLSRVLARAGIATVQPIDGWVYDGADLAATGWRRVRETRQAIDWEAIGASVRAAHQLSAGQLPSDYPLASPRSFPWWDFVALLSDVGAEIDRSARAGLEDAVERNAWWADAVGQQQVVCHGDVHPGNVLTSPGGPLLIDWDLLCWAPPAWDHAALVMWADRWGGDPDMYARFADGYGTSFADDPLTVALGELRNVAATLMRVRAARTDTAAAVEAERRLMYWRGDPDPPTWRAQ